MANAVRSDARRNLMYGLLFTSPWIIGFILFLAFPLALSIYFSFCDYSILNSPAWIGTLNYQDLASDEVFWRSVRNTLFFVLTTLPLGTGLALLLAILLNTNLAARSLFRTIFFLPSLVPLVAVAIVWREALHVQHGVVNHFMGLFGLKSMDWMGDPRFAPWGLVLTTLWGVGNATVIYLASLQEVPRSLYEAAEVDGANALQRIRHVTIPLISPVIYFNVIMGCIGTMQVFALPYVMTTGGGRIAGGPARSTLFYTMYLFDQAFSYLNMGYASAMAWVLFLIIAGLTVSAHFISRRYIHTGGSA